MADSACLHLDLLKLFQESRSLSFRRGSNIPPLDLIDRQAQSSTSRARSKAFRPPLLYSPSALSLSIFSSLTFLYKPRQAFFFSPPSRFQPPSLAYPALFLLEASHSQLMNLWQDPPFLSQILSGSWPREAIISQAFEICKWSAIFLATLACFGTLIHRVVKLSALGFPKCTPLAAQQPLADDYDDSDDDACSSSSEEDDGRSDEEELPSPSDHHSHGDFTFRLAGSGGSQLRRRRSFADNLSQFVLGKSVVKLWDRSDSRLLRLQDSNGEFVGRFCQVLASPRSPVAVVSAGLNNLGKIALNVWDGRVGFRIPAIAAEWEPRVGGGELTVGDLRNVISPVEDSLGADAERWWDADAVVASDES